MLSKSCKLLLRSLTTELDYRWICDKIYKAVVIVGMAITKTKTYFAELRIATSSVHDQQ